MPAKKTKKNPTTALASSGAAALALPGAAAADDALLDQVVADINRLHTAKGLELARALGEYLVGAFFGGSLDNFKVERSHASWRALAERADLQVSHSTLWYSVSILAQLRELPEEIGSALSVSHHRRLLPVRDAKAKQTIATKAVDQGLSVNQLEKLVAKQRNKERKGDRRGRRPIPDYLKSLRRLPRLVEPLTSYEITAADVEAAGVEQMQEVLGSLSEQLETLAAAKEELERALGEARPTR